MTIGSFAAAAAALAFAGAMTAFIGQRLRPPCPARRDRLPRAPPFGAIGILHLAGIFLVPLLLTPLGLAPAAGAGDGAGFAACVAR